MPPCIFVPSRVLSIQAPYGSTMIYIPDLTRDAAGALMSFLVSPWFVMLGCAELLLLLVSSNEIKIVCKSARTRTAGERRRIENGLRRSLLLEATVFVPASTILVLVVVRPWLVSKFGMSPDSPQLNGLLGVISYGFPFAALRRITTRIALNTLKEFQSLLPEAQESYFPEAPEPSDAIEEEPGKQRAPRLASDRPSAVDLNPESTE